VTTNFLTMKIFFTFLVIFTLGNSFAQTNNKIVIPSGVVYGYADNATNEKAKRLIIKSLAQRHTYDLLQDNLIVGPSLWKRFQHLESLKSIPKDVIFHIDNLQLDGKMCQEINDSKKVWDEVKKELSKEYQVRKANEDELKYYWSTISFDIEEPLFIIVTDSHRYILNFQKDNGKLFWLDEFPVKNSYDNPIDNTTYRADGGFKTYQNGNEVFSTSKGERETKLEKVIFLSSDADLKANTSVEDIQIIIDKTNVIFENLFKNSEKSGNIMVQLELGKKKNDVLFALRGDLDLDIMREFEKQINAVQYPKAKKTSIKLQIVFKVNSFNDSE